MAKTRQIRKRIISVRNINKITRTMERVAQSKAMKLTGRFDGATAYRGHLARLLPEALGVAPGTDDADVPVWFVYADGTRKGGYWCGWEGWMLDNDDGMPVALEDYLEQPLGWHLQEVKS